MTACRICLEGEGDLVQPCDCKGTAAHVHLECLQRWLEVSERTTCEICHSEFHIEDRQEIEWVCCPRIVMSEDRYTSSLLFMMGCVLCMIISFSTDDFFFDAVWFGNTLQLTVLLCLYSGKVRALETLFVWKCLTSVSFMTQSLVSNKWEYTYIEGALTLILGLFVYIKNVRRVRTIRILYIDDENESI